MIYKGYEGKAKFDEKAGIFRGEVINTKDVITFKGTSVNQLKKAFRDSVDHYLEFCKSEGVNPEEPFSGKFVLRLSPQLHRLAVIGARREGKSLNTYVEEAIIQRLKDKTSKAAG